MDYKTITGQIVAIIKFRMKKEGEGIPSTAIREILVLKALKHPNLVSLHGVLSVDLKNFMDNLPPDNMMDPELMKNYLYQLTAAMLFCHKLCVLHHDLKPQILLINKEGVINVADF